MIQSIVFSIVTIIAFYFAFRQFMKVRRNILLGKEYEVTGDKGKRWQNVALIAFGQKKMFKRVIPAILHFCIYAAFLFTTVELIEILIDGIFGHHRFFADKIGILYPTMIGIIEILSFLAFFATLIFLWRRNLLKIPRFHKDEMTGWPKLDGNLILVGELILLIGITCMNGTDVLLQDLDPTHFKDTGTLPISSWLGPALFGSLSEGALHMVERFGWWLHVLVVFGFLNYLPKSKHLHIMLAFPNTYFAPLESRGKMENMPAIMNEVKSMMDESAAMEDTTEELPTFGAKDVMDLTWKNVLDAYTCTECGRCTDNCPANMTGKKLSPRKIMMDIRDRAEEIGSTLDQNKEMTKESYDDGKSLFDYITKEEIYACTSCQACVEACPVMINPMEPILALRRYDILMDSAGPSDWLPMFNSIENSGSAWTIPGDRHNWAKSE